MTTNPKMTTEYFSVLFDYNRMANRSFLGLMQSMEDPSDRMVALMGHILNAQSIWLKRINREPDLPVPWRELEVENMPDLDDKNYLKTRQLLDKLESGRDYNLNSVIQYKNSKGLDFKNTIWEILLHIVNHSTYHRGQLAVLLKENNIEPPATDFIFYRR